ncbi:MAG: DUF3592 domain-containing protein [Anaerolineales bacterium]
MRSPGLIFLVVGLIMLAVALFVWLNGTWFRIQADEVIGTVVEVRLTAYSDGNAYCPVVRYRSHSGETLTHYSNICSSPAAYEQGQQVTMYVDRTDPERVQMDDFFGIWFLPLFLGFMGTIFSGVGFFTEWPGFLQSRWGK